MKKTPTTKLRKVQDMASEYRFDYKKAKPNRFAARMKDEPLIVMIEPDIAKVFKILRAGKQSITCFDFRNTGKEID